MSDSELDLMLRQTAQARATEQPIEGGPLRGGMVDVYSWLSRGGSLVAPWWSRARDRQLRGFWKQSDALSSAMFTLQSKVLSIPVHVEPRDYSIRSHIRQASQFEDNLNQMTDFGRGWVEGMKPAIEDLFGQDNGMFIEVIGKGRKDAPISGPALGLAPLDSIRCVRTRNPEFPVYYYDTDGTRYKLHYTRVIFSSQMPASIVELNRVGFCAVSRCIMAAQNLYDIATYKMEKLGSRPKRQLIVARKGLSLDDVLTAMRMADSSMDNEGLSRFAKNIVIAPKRALTNVEIDLEIKDLISAPDGFDEQTAVTLGVYILAWAFGVDAREFWPATSSGATKADAMVQHMKARGKAIGNTIAMLEMMLNRFFLPTHLKAVFDVQDDDEDQQRAAIEETRSVTLDRDLKGKILDVRTARLKMVEEGHLEQMQFEELELSDGRLEGGEDVLSLFYSNDPRLLELLDLSEAEQGQGQSFDPLEKGEVTWSMLAPVVEKRRLDCLRLMAQQLNASTAGPKVAAKQALAALDALEKYWGKGAQKPTGVASGAHGENPAGQVDEAVQKETVSLPFVEGTAEAPKARDEDGSLDKDSSNYANAIHRLCHALWGGRITRFEFVDSLFSTMRRNFAQAWQDGRNRVDAGPMTDEDMLRVQDIVAEQATYAPGLAEFIEANGKVTGSKLYDLLPREEQWVAKYEEVAAEAMVSARGEQRLRWDWNPAVEEHCEDCEKLNGRVYTAATWARYDLRPKAYGLKCGPGRHCGCEFTPTSDPVTPGRPPVDLRGKS